MNEKSNQSLAKLIENNKREQKKYLGLLKNKKIKINIKNHMEKKIKCEFEKGNTLSNPNLIDYIDESNENNIKNIFKEKVLDTENMTNLLASIKDINFKFVGSNLSKLDTSNAILCKSEANGNIEMFSYKILEYDNVEDADILLVYEKSILGEKKTDMIEIKGCDYKKLQPEVYLNDTMVWFHLR